MSAAVVRSRDELCEGGIGSAVASVFRYRFRPSLLCLFLIHIWLSVSASESGPLQFEQGQTFFDAFRV